MNSFKSERRKQHTSSTALNSTSSFGTTAGHTPSMPQEQDNIGLHAGHSFADFTIHRSHESDAATPIQKVDATQGQTQSERPEQAPSQGRRENQTGLPDSLKAGVEHLSGLSLDDVHVHYNSPKPAQLQALAHTQGTEIHVGPGQEKHLAHEAWHVVQQKQGLVRATLQMKGVAINDDAGLEREADVMGAKAAQTTQKPHGKMATSIATPGKLTGFHPTVGTYPAQRKIKLPGKTLSTYDSAMLDDDFKNAIAEYEGFGEKNVTYHAKQLFSTGYDYKSLVQFLTELEYDLQTKSNEGEQLTLQERYMTTYGWNRAATDPERAVPSSDGLQELRLYRTMSKKDWQEIARGNYDVLAKGHLGDFKQALRYFNGLSSDSKVLVEFKLKRGAEQSLFSSGLALPRKRERSDQLKTMATAMGGPTADFPRASKNEGMSDTNIGIKSESAGEAGFSIGISNKNVAKLFSALVDSAKVVMR